MTSRTGTRLVGRLMEARADESALIAQLVNQAEAMAEAARWLLEEHTEDARERLAGAVAAWEAQR